jgi:putative DNA primase/helicase
MSTVDETDAGLDGLLAGLTDVPESELGHARPEIRWNDRDLDDLTSDAVEAIWKANQPPALFQRPGALVRIRTNKETGSPSLETLGVDSLRGLLARVATWFTEGKDRSGNTVCKRESPPLDVVRDLLSLPSWPEEAIPPLIGIIERPTFAADGTLITTPGYDPAARFWYQPAPGLGVPVVEDEPGPERVEEAKKTLLVDLLGDFPFKDEASPTNALALLLLPFVRSMIAGPTPLHMIDAARAGTGKGLLVDAIHIVATGRCATVTPEVGEDDEWRKRIFAALLDGAEFLVIDNINHYLDSGALASCLTARTIRDRVLATSRTAEVAVRCIWVGTGNNVRMSQELARRSPLIRLVARAEKPWERPASGFRHPDLLGWALANRGPLVAAALTLCRAWVAAGRPMGRVTVGSYESWAATLGGIMEVIHCPGFMANAGAMMTNANDDGAKWSAFVSCWWQAFGDAKVEVAALYPLVERENLLEGVLGDGNVQSRKIKLGHRMRKLVDGYYGDLQVISPGHSRNGSPLYQLVPGVGVDGTAAPGGLITS